MAVVYICVLNLNSEALTNIFIRLVDFSGFLMILDLIKSFSLKREMVLLLPLILLILFILLAYLL